MPRIHTPAFGPLDYFEDAVIEFPAGLPAFEDQTRFVLVERPESAPVVFLQSLLRPELSFLTLPARTVLPSYQVEIPPEDMVLLGLPDPDPPAALLNSLVCLAIITTPAGALPTANLLAPIVIHPGARRGAQVVQTRPGCSLQHPLFDALGESPCS